MCTREYIYVFTFCFKNKVEIPGLYIIVMHTAIFLYYTSRTIRKASSRWLRF